MRALSLAPGERLLWQGRPDWRGTARRVFHVRAVAGYFAALLLLDVVGARQRGFAGPEALRACVPVLATAAAVLGILVLLAWATGRTTRYSITDRRVVLRFGLALPATLSMPLSRIAAASVRLGSGAVGDVSLRLFAGERVGFAKLWPHVRPWRFAAPEPMLRDLPEAGPVATLLCHALAEAAEVRRVEMSRLLISAIAAD